MSLAEEFRSCWLVASFGIILFVAGTGVLFWNEGRAVHTTQSLDEAMNDAFTLDPQADFEQNYNGRIVHFIGPIVIGEPLTEPDYNIQILAVKLHRRVQMYQWVEETIEQNFGQSAFVEESDSRTYYYTREWKDKLIDSRSFSLPMSHRNPDRFPIETNTQVADLVFIGKLELGAEIKDEIDNFMELTSDTRPEDASIKMHLGFYYHTNDVFNPEIGDLRLLFSFAGLEGETYTIVGKLINKRIVPYRTSRDAKIMLVYQGELSLHEVFKQEHHRQRRKTWEFRFVGWGLIFFGVTCTSKLLGIILSQMVFFSAMAPDRHYPAIGNFKLALSLALVIAAVAWIMHSPVIGAGLIFAAASPFLWCARGVISYHRVD